MVSEAATGPWDLSICRFVALCWVDEKFPSVGRQKKVARAVGTAVSGAGQWGY